VGTDKPLVWLTTVMGVMALNLWGCATDLPPLADQTQVTNGVVVGRVLTVVTGERTRRYQAEVRFFEVEEQRTQERFHIEIDSEDRHFVLPLPLGDYRLTRVEISEGPFQSMADLGIEFSVGQSPVTYVGTWRFGVDSPRYGRMVAVSMVLDQRDRAGALDFLNKQYPALDDQPVEERSPRPPQVEARLFEVMPYPRVHRYFRRHWW